MRKFDANTGLQTARRSVLFTKAALEASDRHERLVVAIALQLEGWTPVAEARRAADDAVTYAHARVSWGDYLLDRAVKGLANELLRDAGGNYDDKLFREFFPEPPSEVIRMGLESELNRCERFQLLATKRPLNERVSTALSAVTAAMETGRAALAARRAAFMQQAETSLDAVSWKEATEAVRQSVHLQLQAWALENGEERSYAERFFFDPRPGKGKSATATATKGPKTVSDGGDD